MTRPSLMIFVAGLLVLTSTSLALAGSLQATNSAAYAGSLGLEVAIDSSCAADVDVSLDSESVEGLVQACRSITASDVVVTGTGASFVAGEWIEVEEELSVGALSPFSVAIESSLYPFAFVRDLSPAGETAYVAAFALRLDSLTLGTGDRVVNFAGNASDGLARFQVILEQSGGQNRVVLGAREDDGTMLETTGVLLPGGWNEIEVTYEAGAGTGSVEVALNGVPQGGLTGLSNAAGLIASADWGAVDGVFTATSGTLELDEFSSTR